MTQPPETKLTQAINRLNRMFGRDIDSLERRTHIDDALAASAEDLAWQLGFPEGELDLKGSDQVELIQSCRNALERSRTADYVPVQFSEIAGPHQVEVRTVDSPNKAEIWVCISHPAYDPPKGDT
jgi:hypothetical protein